jgi:hypothetical protein
MATNQIYRLPQASFVTCLSQGRIAEQGKYDDLMRQGGLVANLVAEFSSGEKESKQEVGRPLPDALTETAEDAKSEKAEEGEKSAKGQVKLSTYLLYLKGMGFGNAAICTLYSSYEADVRVPHDSRSLRYRNHHQHLPPGMDESTDTDITSQRVRQVPRRILWDAARILVCLLCGYHQCVHVRTSDRQQKSARMANQGLAWVSRLMTDIADKKRLAGLF